MIDLALFGMSGPWEILIVLLVILLLFGAKRLPDLARSLGKSLSEFKKGKEEGARMLDPGAEEKPKDPDARSGSSENTGE